MAKNTFQRSLLIGCMMLIFIPSFAQKFTISGTIKDSSTGEDLIGASVVLKDSAGVGTVTNIYGFYSFTLPKGVYQLSYQFVGFEPELKQVNLTANQVINIELAPAMLQLKAVEITAEAADENVTSTRMGIEKIDVKQIESIPVLFGERDVLKTMQLLPGVKGAGEGSSGFYVRGGGLDQNLILLDEAPVYSPSHLLGFFSVFNSDALKDVTLYKGATPAEYGGRASSVMDIRMKDGNSKKMAVSGGIGVIASRLTIEAPIVKDKGSFMISGRRTYADLFLKLSSDSTLNTTSLYFYDLNLKANYNIGKKDRVYLSGYLGSDVFGFGDAFGINWGNQTATLRWNHIFSDKLFSNTSAIYSKYAYAFEFGADDSKISIESFIQDYNLKQDFTYYLNNNNTLKFGGNAIYHTFESGNIVAGDSSGFSSATADPRNALETALYLQNEQKVNGLISLNYGLRYSWFANLGEGYLNYYDETGTVTASDTFGTNQIMNSYAGFEPRISAKIQLGPSSSIKTGYNRNYQYLHQISNSTSSVPTDLWTPSTNNIKPQIADQVSIGYFKNLKKNAYEFSVETYYKWMQNLAEYRTGSDIFQSNDIESKLVYGTGDAYGAEFMMRKKTGKLTGWVSYTLSRSLRNFDAIDNGATFSARQDRIHDISIVGMYAFNEKIKLSATWVYNTGDAVTFPSGQYVVNGNTLPYYTERNGYRMPDYHRLDVGITIEGKQRKRYQSSWNISCYNTYGRKNAYSISFQQNESTGQNEAVKLSLFQWVPSVTYNFNF